MILLHLLGLPQMKYSRDDFSRYATIVLTLRKLRSRDCKLEQALLSPTLISFVLLQ